MRREYENKGSDVPAYVADGLECLFDGITNTASGHNASATVWADLTGNGYDMTLAGQGTLEGGSVSWTNNSCRMVNVGDKLLNGFRSLKTFSPNKESFTLELVIRINTLTAGGNYVVALWNNSGDNYQGRWGLGVNSMNPMYSLCIATQAGNDIKARSTSEPKTAIGLMQSMSFLKPQGIQSKPNVSLILNGSKYDGYDFNRYSQASSASPRNLALFTYYPDWTFPHQYTDRRTTDSEIFSIRLYNRALTDSERLQNYNIDRNRFNF